MRTEACALKLVFAASLLLCSSGSAYAQNWSWIWSGVSSGDFSYSYNKYGHANSVVRTGTGSYVVYFPRLGGLTGGNVQISSYGYDGSYCKVGSWYAWNDKNDVAVNVYCFGPTGLAQDQLFTAIYQGHVLTTGGSWGAYTWNDQAAATTNTAYTPTAAYTWNSSGGTTRITRTGTGTYKVVFNGQTEQAAAQRIIDAGGVAQGPTVLVTAYGTGPEWCQAGSITGNSTSTTVNVTCWRNPSNPVKANSLFSLSFGSKRPFMASSMGYMHEVGTQSARSANLFIGAMPGSWAMQHERTATGVYRVYFPGMVSWYSSAAMVTASSTSARRCTVTSWWGAPMGGTAVEVRCFGVGNTPADTRFNIAYGTSQKPPLPGTSM